MTTYPVWPIPQELTLREEALPLSRAVLSVPARGNAEIVRIAQLCADLLADDFGVVVPLVRGKAPAGARPIRIEVAGAAQAGTPGLPGAEGYLLSISAKGAKILGRDARGAQHGVATLVQLARRRGEEVEVQGAEVRDWPYKPIRMVHLYAPGPDHLDYARRYLRDFLVRYKYNGLFIEVGGGTRLRRHPEIPVAWRRFVEEINAVGELGVKFGMHVPLGPDRRCGNSLHTHLADGSYLEPDELSRLFDWAREYHLDPVPEIQSLAHVYYLVNPHRELAELPEADFPDAYCPSNPKSYELMFDVMQEYVDLTKCRSVHIGHDEWRAGGLCPACRERDTGELFAEDVLKMTRWLAERGLGTWMWGDHLLLKHNALGCDWDDRRIWHNYATTLSAAAILQRAAPDITILNWSHGFGRADSDDVIADLGFKQIFGNFPGRSFEDWSGRSARPEVLGAGVSSWTAWEDYELGMLNLPTAMYSANLMWSNHWPEADLASERTARELPRLRNRLRRSWEKPHLWSEVVRPERKHIISLGAAAAAKLPEEMRPAVCGCASEYDDIPFAVTDRAVVVERLHQSPGRYPYDSQPVAVNGHYASLIFWQVASEPGNRPMHAGDGTNYPREAAELLGWYEIRYEDGLVRAAEVRYGENVRAWNEGYGLLYHAREVPIGRQADGAPLVMWGFEWTNPRPGVEIVSVTLHGAKATPHLRDKHRITSTRPMLLGITGIEAPNWGDFRPGKAGRWPGWTEPEDRVGPPRRNYGPKWITEEAKPEDEMA